MRLARSRGKDKFYIPGGKRELDETDAQALNREIEEELSVTLDPNTLQFVGTFQAQTQTHAQLEGVLVQVTCYAGSYTPVQKLRK